MGLEGAGSGMGSGSGSDSSTGPGSGSRTGSDISTGAGTGAGTGGGTGGGTGADPGAHLEAEPSASPAFFGVTRSVLGLRWQGPDATRDRAALTLAQRLGLPDPVCRVLAARGVFAEDAEAWLTPTLRDLMPDPSSVADLDKAAARLVGAVCDRARIAVFADYDVDGAASAALLMRWLAKMDLPAGLYIPDRVTEGYGPNSPAMMRLAQAHDLILCVDCGTHAHAPIADAQAVGADVLVVDHHLPGETLPAVPVVNPNRRDDSSGLGGLCAAGVVFLLLVACNRLLRAQNRSSPDLMALLDLVALATVADVVPLTGLNRAFVRQGLRVMGQRHNPGLAALCDRARLHGRPSAQTIGFALGPRINAGGRVGRADLGARLLVTDRGEEAQALADSLERHNRLRQTVEAEVLAAAHAQAEACPPDAAMVWAAGEGWHPGVVGIVAARLREAFDKPAVVLTLERSEAKGSGRSVPGVDLGRAVVRLVGEGVLRKGGGHRMAAGLTVARDAVAAAMARLSECLSECILERAGSEAAPKALQIDGSLAAGGAGIALLEAIEAAGPFGASAPEPRFALAAVRIETVRELGGAHLALRCRDGAGATLEAVAFRARPGPLGTFLAARQGQTVHLAGRLSRDAWNGRARMRLLIDDAAPG